MVFCLSSHTLADPPDCYHDTVNATNSTTLRTTLHEVIDHHTRIRYPVGPPTDTWDVLELADEDPNNADNILDVYKNACYEKFGGGNNLYNREHTWPNSYGFPDDGSNNYPYTFGTQSSSLERFTAPRQERIEALKFVVHFVGDVHQPLHLGNARDRGGNDVKVTFFENNTNLHSLWDSGMIRRTQKGWTEYATELAAKITPQERVLYDTLDPVVWATESHKLAHSNAYDVPKDGRLGQDYFDKNILVIERRLSMAGVRLAALLNAIFDETKALPSGLSEPLEAE